MLPDFVVKYKFIHSFITILRSGIPSYSWKFLLYIFEPIHVTPSHLVNLAL